MEYIKTVETMKKNRTNVRGFIYTPLAVKKGWVQKHLDLTEMYGFHTEKDLK